MGGNYKLNLGVDFKGFLQSNRIHVPSVPLCIDEDRNSALVNHRIHGGIKGHVGAEYPFPFHCAVADGRFPVELFPREFHTQVEGCSATG